MYKQQTQTMRKFRLLKDLPGIAKGAISDCILFNEKSQHFARFLNTAIGIHVNIPVNDKEWIEEITQITVTQLSFEEQVDILEQGTVFYTYKSLVKRLNDTGYHIVKI